MKSYFLRNKNLTASLLLLLLITVLTAGQNLYSQNMGSTARININRIDLPFNNQGNIAEVQVPDGGRTNGYFEGHEFLFSADIILSGFTNDSMWANETGFWQAYQPGTIGMAPEDSLASIYRVGAEDVPFGSSWQDWKDAVDLGADFYDANNDGVYEPVDLNNNGVWDPNEDKPDMIGDESFWCVYNDGVPISERRYLISEPQGIEIRQTIFGFSSAGILDSVVFVRYRIKNTGLLADTLKNVYFGHLADVDIGEIDGFEHTRIGCDTLRNASYGYHTEPSPWDWGNNPPCFLTDILTGPLSFVPGISFEDLNNNNIYDEGIDIPFDTARSFRGPLGAKIYPGAQNLNMTASIFIINASPGYNDPSNIIEARNYLYGLTQYGELADPCTFPVTHVLGGIPCGEINPHFWCSGDPVTANGWLPNFEGNVRKIQSTGPFTLPKNQEIEILIGLIVGRGDSALGSVTVAKEMSDYVKSFYENNFGYPLDLNGNHGPTLDPEYKLFQNYPNPFNSTCRISYSISEDGIVTIEIFNVLGQKVTTILNKFQNADRDEVEFNGSALASGIYIYRMKVNDFITSKKMVLIK